MKNQKKAKENFPTHFLTDRYHVWRYVIYLLCLYFKTSTPPDSDSQQTKIKKNDDRIDESDNKQNICLEKFLRKLRSIIIFLTKTTCLLFCISI